MKKTIILIYFISFSYMLMSQWTTEKQFIDAYQYIEKCDEWNKIIPLLKNRPKVDKQQLEDNISYLRTGEEFVEKSITKLKKYKISPRIYDIRYWTKEQIDLIGERSYKRLVKKNDSIEFENRHNKIIHDDFVDIMYGDKTNYGFPYINNSLIKINKYSLFFINQIKARVYDRFGIYIFNPSKKMQDQKPVKQVFFNALSFLDLTKAQKDSLLKFEYMNPVARARLGDTIAEQKCIEKFWEFINDSLVHHEKTINGEYDVDNYTDYTGTVDTLKRNHAYNYDNIINLLYIDSPKSWDAFFTALQQRKGRFEWNFEPEPEDFFYYPHSHLLLHAYNLYFYHDLIYFQNRVKHQRAGEWYAYYQEAYLLAVQFYLSDKHQREIRIPLTEENIGESKSIYFGEKTQKERLNILYLHYGSGQFHKWKVYFNK